MVGAAVAAHVGSARIRSIDGMGFATSRGEPTLRGTTGVVSDAIRRLPTPSGGPIVAERGEFYEEPAMTVESLLDAEFKYVETIAERRVVEAAHHAAYATRSLYL
uniref:DUF2209 family protein n=1 Tax=Natronorarus salvus TaxID=3117733 RepID=UPI0039081F79